MRRLAEAVKQRIVGHLACYNTHAEVVDLIAEVFDVTLTRRRIRAYDPDSFQLKFRAVPEALLKLQQANRLSAADKEPIVARLDDELLAIR